MKGSKFTNFHFKSHLSGCDSTTYPGKSHKSSTWTLSFPLHMWGIPHTLHGRPLTCTSEPRLTSRGRIHLNSSRGSNRESICSNRVRKKTPRTIDNCPLSRGFSFRPCREYEGAAKLSKSVFRVVCKKCSVCTSIAVDESLSDQLNSAVASSEH